MKIYEYNGFPSPRRVRIFLAEKGIKGIEFEQVDVPEGEHRKAPFLAKNPFGTVPVLEMDDGTCISETAAICRYFEERHPAPALMGETPEKIAEIEMWHRRVEQTMYDTVATYFHHATPGLGDLETYQNEAWGKKNKEKFFAAMVQMDAHLKDRDFFVGEGVSVVDITALCAIDFGGFVDLAIPTELKNLTRWYDGMSNRPSATS